MERREQKVRGKRGSNSPLGWTLVLKVLQLLQSFSLKTSTTITKPLMNLLLSMRIQSQTSSICLLIIKKETVQMRIFESDPRVSERSPKEKRKVFTIGLYPWASTMRHSTIACFLRSPLLSKGKRRTWVIISTEPPYSLAIENKSLVKRISQPSSKSTKETETQARGRRASLVDSKRAPSWKRSTRTSEQSKTQCWSSHLKESL